MALNFSPDDFSIINNMRRELNDIRSHDGDIAWFGYHESRIRNTVWRTIDKPPVFGDAVTTLFVSLQNLHSHKEYQSWARVVSDTLLIAGNLKNDKLQARLWLAYGDFMLREGQVKMAARSAEIGTGFVSEGTGDAEDMRRAEGMLLLLCALQPVSAHKKTMRMVAQTLKYVKRIKSTRFKAHAYRLLAHFYVFQGDYKPAEGLTRRALDLWESLEDSQGRVDCLINLSRIARKQDQFDKVDDLMSQTQIDPDSPNGHRQFMNRMYEEAAYMLQSGNFEKAREMLYWTIEYLESIGAKRELAPVRHTLALTQIAQHDFEKAEETLAIVEKMWNEQQNAYGLAEVCVARSYMERERGRKIEAREWLIRAEKISADIKNEMLREQMLIMIRGESGKLND